MPSALYILGPTAVGKSDVALELARRLRGEIVSADSMQLYRGMDIGTAKPTAAERGEIPHHLIDVLDITQRCDVAAFQKMAMAAIHAIQSRGARAIVVGGSGMYIRALTQGLCEGPGRDDTLRTELEALETEALRARCREVDPAAAVKILPGDRRRFIRAIEFHASTGQPISSRQTQWHPAKKDALLDLELVGLNRPREEIYRRCDARVQRMFDLGWVDEVRGLLRLGLASSPTASKAIGYAEILRLLAGETTLSDTVAEVQKRTRNLVKRQLAWFRKEPGIRWLDLSADESAAKVASRILEPRTALS